MSTAKRTGHKASPALPIFDHAAEAAVLGHLLLDPVEAWPETSAAGLSTHDFVAPGYTEIFAAAKNQYERGQAADVVGVYQRMLAEGRTDIVREFTKFSQFLVVTHNKRTVSAADTISRCRAWPTIWEKSFLDVCNWSWKRSSLTTETWIGTRLSRISRLIASISGRIESERLSEP